MVITSFTAELLKLLLVRGHDTTRRPHPLPPLLACHPLQLPATYKNYTNKTHTSLAPCDNCFWTAWPWKTLQRTPCNSWLIYLLCLMVPNKLKMKALQSFKMQKTTSLTTKCQVPENFNCQQRCFGNLKSGGKWLVWYACLSFISVWLLNFGLFQAAVPADMPVRSMQFRHVVHEHEVSFTIVLLHK